MNKLDRKKMAVYERTLGHFIDKLRQFYNDLDSAIFKVGNTANNTYTAVTNLNDLILELKTKSDLLIMESNSQNARLEKFRVEIRNSLERNFTEQRERMKRAIKKLPDEERPKFAKAEDITSGPPISFAETNMSGIYKFPERRSEPKVISFFGLRRLKVEL